MDLSNSQNNFKGKDDFIDLVNHPRQGGGVGDMTDEILPNYDFQPIRPHLSSQHSNFHSGNAAGITAKSSVESKANSGTTDSGLIDSMEPAKYDMEKDPDVYKAALISEIDRTMKKHTDNVMNVLEGVSARLSQLENKSRQLENCVDDLKASLANNHGSCDGKLRQIENMIREVQAGVAQLQLSKVQVLEAEQPPETQNSGHQVAASAPLQSYHTQQYQPPPPPPHQQPPQPPPLSLQPQYQPSSHIQFSQPPPLHQSGYPQVPHAVHTGSGVGNGGGSGSSPRVPIDDVVDKVSSMGFPRDEVRATVRKLTENGQAVDLNVVLDKLMTDGVHNHGPKPWFGR